MLVRVAHAREDHRAQVPVEAQTGRNVQLKYVTSPGKYLDFTEVLAAGQYFTL